MLDHRTETFMAVCSVMNYREAAELLHITQPAVTQHIQFLEKEYGCRLFLYENRKLIKTPAAQMLEDYLRSVQQRENSQGKDKKQWSPGTAHRCNQDHW